jgi:quinol monooxygenase YgiN
MLVVHVQVLVKPDCLDAFKQATMANVRSSRQEPGIARFEMYQELADLTRFLLVEIYRTPEASAAHKETQHYQVWRDAVAPMMAGPRSSVKFQEISPDAL